MECITHLKQEHQFILKTMREFETTLDALDKDYSSVEKFISFIQLYADEFHHAKEEELLFKWMIEKNPDIEHGPIACMLKEHNLGRTLVASANDLINKQKDSWTIENHNELIDKLMMFMGMLTEHIDKEDTIHYIMAEQLEQQSQDGDKTMLPQFMKIEHDYYARIQALV